MSIPVLFVKDIAGRGVLVLNAIDEVLKLVGEKENLFADFPIGATMQDGGKRKRRTDHMSLHCQRIKRKRKRKEKKY